MAKRGREEEESGWEARVEELQRELKEVKEQRDGGECLCCASVRGRVYLSGAVRMDP